MCVCLSYADTVLKWCDDLPRHTWSLMNHFRTGQGPVTFLWLWWVTGHKPHCRHVPINEIWRWTESTPRSGWWRSHTAGIYSDCSTREITIVYSIYDFMAHTHACMQRGLLLQPSWVVTRCGLCVSVCWAHKWHTHTHSFNGSFSGTTQAIRYQEGKNQSGFYWSKRQWMTVASAGLYASLHLAPDRKQKTPPLKCFTGRMPFLSPNQQHQSTEGTPVNPAKTDEPIMMLFWVDGVAWSQGIMC